MSLKWLWYTLFTIKIFQHGARAPNVIANDSIAKMFPNGAGETTELGIEESFNLGRFLGERYVGNGFLRSPFLPSEVYFRSRGNNRCLVCAALVASGMWANPDNPEFTPVPVYSQEQNDRILTHLQNCEIETKRLSGKCGKTPPSTKEWSAYEGFVFECLGLNKETKLFKDSKEFLQMEALIQMDRNGMTMSKWFDDNRKEIYDLYTKTYNFIVGVHDHHNKELLQLKQGVLMKQILDLLKKRWDEYNQSGSIAKRKFIAYSAQDWTIMAFADALGCAQEAFGDTLPGHNALIMLELSERANKAVVQVFYKDNVLTYAKDITKAVRGCDQSPCLLSTLLKCCDDYMTEDPKTLCGSQS